MMDRFLESILELYLKLLNHAYPYKMCVPTSKNLFAENLARYLKIQRSSCVVLFEYQKIGMDLKS